MPDLPKQFAVIPTAILKEHGRIFSNTDKARASLAVGETMVQAIAAVEIQTIEFRQRERAEKTAAPPSMPPAPLVNQEHADADWIAVADELPPANEIIDTKVTIDGVEIAEPLALIDGTWQKQDGTHVMAPTHWAYREEAP